MFDCGGAGDSSSWRALITGVQAAGHEIEDVRVLVATHAHSDHIGLAKPVVDASGCTFWLHPNHEAFTDGGRFPDRITASRKRRARKEGVPDDKLTGFATVAEEVEGVELPIPPHLDLVEGKRVETAVGTWEVLETPGHTPSHVCLYERERRLLVAGDLVSRFYAPYFDYGYSYDPVMEFRDSLTRVESFPVEVTLVGHGRPIEDLTRVIEEHRAELSNRISAVHAAVESCQGSGYEIARRAFGAPGSEYDDVYRLGETLALLRHLRLSGAVHRAEAPDGTYRYSVTS
jgi:glyoxylase-like metal-dependent hydrolase (beta-lactamase superfamily II)